MLNILKFFSSLFSSLFPLTSIIQHVEERKLPDDAIPSTVYYGKDICHTRLSPDGKDYPIFLDAEKDCFWIQADKNYYLIWA